MTFMSVNDRDVVVLADAVNQLAMIVESMLPLTGNSGMYVDEARGLRREIRERLIRERERVAPIIERLDP